MNVVTIAEEQYGLITRAQARESMSESAIDRRLATAMDRGVSGRVPSRGRARHDTPAGNGRHALGR